MTADATQRYRLAKKIASTALDLPDRQREPFLAGKCAGDVGLRREVDWLMSAALTEPVNDIPESLAHLHATPAFVAEGTRVAATMTSGEYHVLRRIGEGGMGVVFIAERADGANHQRVALKFLNAPAHSHKLIQRFAAERRIIAGLHHPNIAHIVDGGTTREGRPFIALEYVEGEHIDEWCTARSLSLHQRIELFLKVCDAVSHAHQHLVIHRDLKPTNILVTAEGEPKLLDFGIARLLDDTDPGLTETGQRAFTVAYASPEQIEGRPLTTAVDIWALGVLLYKLVCGVGPFGDLDNPHQISNAITSGHITPPSRRMTQPARSKQHTGTHGETPQPKRVAIVPRRHVPRDIDAIVLKALRRDPDARYASVDELAADLRNFQSSRPVLARRGQRLYAMRKFTWRHRFGLAMIALIIALLAGGLVQRQQQLHRVEIERDKAQTLAEFMNGLFKSADPMNTSGTEVTARTLLKRGARKLRTRSDLDPAAKSAMLLSIGNAYIGLGAGKEAIPLLQEAQSLLPDSAPVASRIATAAALGDAYSLNGDYHEALRAHGEALRLLQTEPGRDGRDLLSQQVNIAADHRLLGDVPASETIATLNRLRKQLKASAARNNPGLADFVDYNLASAYTQAGNAAAAQAVMRDAVAQAEHDFGALDPRTLHDRWQLARALVADHPREAATMLQKLLPDYARVEDTRSKTWALMLNDLSSAQTHAGDTPAALDSQRKARAAALAAGGPRDNYYLILSGNLATTLVKAGQSAEAESVVREVLPALQAQAPEGGIHRAAYAYALAVLAKSQWTRKQYAEAAQNYIAAEHALGADAQSYYTVYRGVLEGEAESAIHANRFAAATKALAELQAAIAKAHRPADSLDALRLHLLQTRLAFARKDYGKAETIASSALSAMQSPDSCKAEVGELETLRGKARVHLGLSAKNDIPACLKDTGKRVGN